MSDWINQYQQFAQTPWSPTKLSKQENAEFEKWMKGTQLFKSIKTDVAQEQNIPLEKLDDSRILQMILRSPDYDYRGAWKDKVEEVISPYDNKPHWPSSTKEGAMLKNPAHPTAWKEFFMRQYKIDPDSIGLDTFEKAKNWNLSTQKIENIFYKDPFGTDF